MRLSDGRVIKVQRHQEYRKVTDPGAGFRAGWLFQRSGVVADLPSPANRKVSWEGTLQPIALDIQPDSIVYLVCVLAAVANRAEWNLPRDERHAGCRLQIIQRAGDSQSSSCCSASGTAG